ncbi:MAG: rhodanese-like domain-containing protein, partial [Halobaculum sp.]
MTDPQPDTVTAASLARRLRAGEEIAVLDLRDRDAFERWGIEGRTVRATQVPHVRFVAAHATGDVRDPLPDLSEPILVVCARGEASGQVAGWLREAGVDARNLAGGTAAWAETVLAAEFDAGPLFVRQYQRPATGCLSYLVADDDEAVVIDPLRAATDRLATDADDLG